MRENKWRGPSFFLYIFDIFVRLKWKPTSSCSKLQHGHRIVVRLVGAAHIWTDEYATAVGDVIRRDSPTVLIPFLLEACGTGVKRLEVQIAMTEAAFCRPAPELLLVRESTPPPSEGLQGCRSEAEQCLSSYGVNQNVKPGEVAFRNANSVTWWICGGYGPLSVFDFDVV